MPSMIYESLKTNSKYRASKGVDVFRKSWDTSAFLGLFPMHTRPAPPLTPQTKMDACIQNLFQLSNLYGWEQVELKEKF